MTRKRLIAPALFLMTGLLVVAADRDAFGQPGKKDKEKEPGKREKLKDKGPGKAAKDLRKAFDAITDLSQDPVAGKEAARVFDHAKRFYTEAVKAYPEDPRRAAELAVAANDAARGLGHLRRAATRPVPGLPEPPAESERPFAGPKEKGPPPPNGGPAGEQGPWSESLDALTVARERLSEVDREASITGPARDVLDAAKAAYAQARTSYEAGEYRKAAELARAAEAWSHVLEHLNRAGWETIAAPPLSPMPRAKGPGAPPPPPAIKE